MQQRTEGKGVGERGLGDSAAALTYGSYVCLFICIVKGFMTVQTDLGGFVRQPIRIRCTKTYRILKMSYDFFDTFDSWCTCLLMPIQCLHLEMEVPYMALYIIPLWKAPIKTECCMGREGGGHSLLQVPSQHTQIVIQ